MEYSENTENELEVLRRRLAEKDALLYGNAETLRDAIAVMKTLERENTENRASISELGQEVYESRGKLGRVRLYVNNFDKLLSAYALMGDEKSRLVFRNRALWWISDAYEKREALIRQMMEPCTKVSPDMVVYNEKSEPVPVMCDENQYYPEGLFTLGKTEVFLDVGAFTGDTVLQFVEKTGGEFKAVYALEPSRANFAKCVDNLRAAGADDRVTVFNAGLSNIEETLFFSSAEDLGAAGVREAAQGKEACEMKPASKILSEEQLGGIMFIKMDVEGDEMKALESLAETIKANKPKLAISVYHKQQDVYEIPLYIGALVPDYRFYMRHHTDIFGDTVLYAVV